MFRWFVRLFPLFIVEWMCRKWSQRFWINGEEYAMPFFGLLIHTGISQPQLRKKRSELELRIAAAISEMRLLKQDHSELRCKFSKDNRSSLLNAWRDGEITFEECVELLAVATKP